MCSQVQTAATKCPETKIVLSGYNQGAQVTHKAAALISSSLYSKIKAIVLFGDPNNGDAFPGSLNDNVKTFCNVIDMVCNGLPTVVPQFVTYEPNVGEAADYVAARV